MNSTLFPQGPRTFTRPHYERWPNGPHYWRVYLADGNVLVTDENGRGVTLVEATGHRVLATAEEFYLPPSEPRTRRLTDEEMAAFKAALAPYVRRTHN